jgi:hypothetical protein
MPLPTQTWAQSALASPAGSGDTVEEVLAAVKTLIDADSNWTASTDGTSQSPAYLEITSANGFGSNVQKFKLLLVEGSDVNAAWALGGTGNWASAGQLNYTPGQSTPKTNGSDDIYVGYVAPPSDGSSTTAQITTGNIFNSTGPYGGTAASDLERFSSFIKCAHDVSDTANNHNIAKVWTLSCQEMLTIGFEDTNGRIKFVHAGAIIAPISDLAGETISNSVGRIYGMCVAKPTCGIDPLPNTPENAFWSNAAQAAVDAGTNVGGFTPTLNSLASGAVAAVAAMIIHYPESNALDAAFNFWSGIQDLDYQQSNPNHSGCEPGCFMDNAGNVIAMPIPIVDGSTKVNNGDKVSRQLVGIMRQVKMANPVTTRSIVQDTEGNVIGYTFTGSRVTAAQGFLYTNS